MITVPGAQTIVAAPTTITGVSVAETGATSGETFTVTVRRQQWGAVGDRRHAVNSGLHADHYRVTLSTLNSRSGSLSDTDGAAGSDTITVNASDSFGNAPRRRRLR